MQPLLLDAPAKLNLSLRVLGKRSDGYHDIDTWMVRLPGLADRLHFEPADAFSFSCSDPTVPQDETNLAVRAVRAYETATGLACRLHLSLEKRIPHGAGLGGGSSDAAATLLALQQLHRDPLAPATLATLAAGLGSDIPFFLSFPSARCRGRGELVEPAPLPPACEAVLLKPAFAVSTPDAYRGWQSAPELPGILYQPQTLPWGVLVNDLERPVFAKHRFLAEMKQWLFAQPGNQGVLMSGSGSVLFAILREGASAAALIEAARRELDPTLWAWSGRLGATEPAAA